MAFQNGIQFKSLVEFWEYLPPEESLITEILRQIVIEQLPLTHQEKLCYNVPYFYLKRRVCFIWPSTIPWGGFKYGVMLGFCYGNRLEDKLQYLTHGTNKQVFYKIYKSVEEIDEDAIKYILSEAIVLDQQW